MQLCQFDYKCTQKLINISFKSSTGDLCCAEMKLMGNKVAESKQLHPVAICEASTAGVNLG